MHTSKLAAFVIDCRTDDFDAAARFWSAALGRTLAPPHDDYPSYRSLEASASEPMLLLQKVDHESRIHLDIESDDVEAEVARLVALGARRLHSVRTWVVLEAPSGQRFCVVRPQRGTEQLRVTRWPSSDAIPAVDDEEHRRLLGWRGRYQGTTRTFLDPTAPPEETLGELRIEPMLGGRWLRIEEHGTVMGKPHAGELVLGFQREPAEYQASWVDTFHTMGAVIHSTGTPREDGVLAVTGSYPAGAERWGWRTELHPPAADGSFLLKAVNISPAGAEFPAIETHWRR